jgi:hypothetical protein
MTLSSDCQLSKRERHLLNYYANLAVRFLSMKIFACEVYIGLVMTIQGDRKVTQHILKHLLMVAIQYSSNGLINTQYHYPIAHAGHVML